MAGSNKESSPTTHKIATNTQRQWRNGIRDQLDAMEKAPEPEQTRPPTSPGSVTGITEHEGVETTIMNVKTKYPGKTLEQAVDSLIDTSAVIMFGKTWCLFSRDARDFLLHQIGVSMTFVPLDECEDGDAIAKYIKVKTGHRTTPVIYIKGAFLGGFEDVNQLYSTGELEEEYLQGLTQADRCEMEARALKSGSKPLLWFPEKVNGHAVRMTGVLTCLCALVACTDYWTGWGAFIAAGLLFDFIMRILAGSKLSVLGRIAGILVTPLKPNPRVGRPKQFAGESSSLSYLNQLISQRHLHLTCFAISFSTKYSLLWVSLFSPSNFGVSGFLSVPHVRGNRIYCRLGHGNGHGGLYRLLFGMRLFQDWHSHWCDSQVTVGRVFKIMSVTCAKKVNLLYSCHSTRQAM